MSSSPSKSLSIFQVFKNSFLFCGANFIKIMPLSILYGALNVGFKYFQLLAPSSGRMSSNALVHYIIHILSYVFLLSIYIKLNTKLSGNQISLWNSIIGGFKRFRTFIFAYVLLILAMALSAALILGLASAIGKPYAYILYVFTVITAFIYCTYMFILFPLIATEDTSALNAISLAYKLLKKQWWHTSVVLLFTLLFIVAVSMGFTMIAVMLAKGHFALSGANLVIFIAPLTLFLLPFYLSISLIQLRHLRAYHADDGTIVGIDDVLNRNKLKFNFEEN